MTHRRPSSSFQPWLNASPWIRYGLSGLLVVIVLAGGWVVKLAYQYGDIEQVEYDPGQAVAAIEQLSEAEVEQAGIDIAAIEQAQLERELAELDGLVLAEIIAAAEAQSQLAEAAKYRNPYASSPDLPDDMFRSYLLIGADASGYLADVIILFLQPTDGSAPIMASLPRDLYVPNACTGAYSRVNSNLGGCVGVANGPTLLALTVADFTGIKIDHFAVVSFEGFSSVIDVMGGVDLCFDHPTRDKKSLLDVDAGCIRADGATTLAWVRSRSTEQLVGEDWVSVSSSDFTRQRNQQDVLFLIAQKLTSFSSLGSFQSVANSLSSSVRLDSGLSFASALSLAWDYRGLQRNQVNRIALSYENYRTPQGAQVLAPMESFNDALSELYTAAGR